MKSKNKLKERYEGICNEYISEFCEKQDFNFEGWVGDNVGEIALCNDFFFNFNDIVYDINTNQQKGLIIDWYYDNLDNIEKSINYFSYSKGLRISDMK